VVGHEHDLARVDLIPDDDAAQRVLEGLPSLLAGEADDLVGNDVTGGRGLPCLDDFVDHVVHRRRTKYTPPAIQRAKRRKSL